MAIADDISTHIQFILPHVLRSIKRCWIDGKKFCHTNLGIFPVITLLILLKYNHYFKRASSIHFCFLFYLVGSSSENVYLTDSLHNIRFVAMNHFDTVLLLAVVVISTSNKFFLSSLAVFCVSTLSLYCVE